MPVSDPAPSPSPGPDLTVKLPSAFLNGMFTLLLLVIICSTFGAFAFNLSIPSFVITVIGTLSFILVSGALQLRQDPRLAQKNFFSLIGMVLRQLPVFRTLIAQIKPRLPKGS